MIPMKMPFDEETFGSDEIIPKPRVEFMYRLDDMPESKLPSRLPDGTLININFSELKDWAESKLYQFVTAAFIRAKLGSGDIKLM